MVAGGEGDVVVVRELWVAGEEREIREKNDFTKLMLNSRRFGFEFGEKLCRPSNGR